MQIGVEINDKAESGLLCGNDAGWIVLSSLDNRHECKEKEAGFLE